MTMTISQALRRISKLKGQIKEHLQRAEGAVTWEEPNPPAFSFGTSWEQAEVARAELIKLETALRVTNAQTKIEWGNRAITLAEATCLLQELRGKIAWLRGLTTCRPQETQTTELLARAGYGSTEVTKVVKTFKCDLTEQKRAEWVRRDQDQFDALNDAVEAVNHRTTLV